MVYLEIALAAMIAATLDTVIGFGGGLLLLPVLVMVVGSKDAVLLGPDSTGMEHSPADTPAR